MPERGRAPGEQPRDVRLQKVLAAAGVASRRAAEVMIEAGRVSVNGAVVREMGVRVAPQDDVIHVDGQRVEVRADAAHVALNKPRGVLSAMSDDRGRPCVGDMVADRGPGLVHIGRLDADTEGLLLLSNDGELAHRLMHPSYEVAKTYVATVSAPLPRGLARSARTGVHLADGPVAADSFRLLQTQARQALVEIVLHEGRNRVVRRLLATLGCPAQRLVRTAVGPVRLGAQSPGGVRDLSRDEVGALYRAVDL